MEWRVQLKILLVRSSSGKMITLTTAKLSTARRTHSSHLHEELGTQTGQVDFPDRQH
jgi:hypothetical protein